MSAINSLVSVKPFEESLDFLSSRFFNTSLLGSLKSCKTSEEFLQVLLQDWSLTSSKLSSSELKSLFYPSLLSESNVYLSGSHSVKQQHAYLTGSASITSVSSEVYASGSSKVSASANSHVISCQSSKVQVSGRSFVQSCDNVTVYASESSTVEARGNSLVHVHSSFVNAYDDVTVTADGLSYIISRSPSVKVQLFEKSVCVNTLLGTVSFIQNGLLKTYEF